MSTDNEPIREEPGEFIENAMPAVNSRGGSGGNPIGKVIFVVGITGLLLVAGFYGYNRYRASRNAEAEAAKQTSKNESKPAQAGIPRDFDKEQAAADAAANPQPAAVANGQAALCKDGTNGVPAVNVDNSPLLSPQGVAMRICADGHIVVPNIQASAQPIGLAGAQGAQGAGVAKPSRYAGDAILSNGSLLPVSSTTNASASGQNTADQAAYLANLMQQVRGGTSGGAVPAAALGAGGAGAASSANSLGSQLTPTNTQKVSASMIGDRNMILPKGRSIDCSLTMRLISDLPGLATCVLAQNVYSDNGKVLLLERGSQAVGEYSSNTAQGQRRIFVLWSRVETPSGVIINLDSPGADELGTSGLPGKVNNHWWERLGAAALLTLVQDAVGYETAKASTGNQASYIVMQNTSQSANNMANLVLQNTIGIKPTLYKNQGDRASIFVARDLDFGSVYGLQPR